MNETIKNAAKKRFDIAWTELQRRKDAGEHLSFIEQMSPYSNLVHELWGECDNVFDEIDQLIEEDRPKSI